MLCSRVAVFSNCGVWRGSLLPFCCVIVTVKSVLYVVYDAHGTRSESTIVLNALGIETQSVVPEAELDRRCPFSLTTNMHRKRDRTTQYGSIRKDPRNPLPSSESTPGWKRRMRESLSERISMCWD
eukprot:1817064-Amphidinium_carterae.1